MTEKTTPQTALRLELPFDARLMFKHAKMELIQITLKPGEIISAHKNPLDVVFLGLQGVIEILVDQQNFQLSPYETLFIAPERTIQIRNASEEPATFAVIKIC